MTIFRLWLLRRDGATAIEYGLMVAAIAIAISVAVLTTGGDLVTLFTDITAMINQGPV